MVTMENNKFELNQTVYVKQDLVVGKNYYSEDGTAYSTFTSGMRHNLGKEAKITAIINNRYRLSTDNFHTFTAEMLEAEQRDYLALNPYEKNKEVEALVDHVLNQLPEQLINRAIDEGDKEEFARLSELYKDYFAQRVEENKK
jgi:hypothetical protein